MEPNDSDISTEGSLNALLFATMCAMSYCRVRFG